MNDPVRLPFPVLDEFTRPYWEGMSRDQVLYQRCADCAHAWLPPTRECPSCLGESWSREVASGRARLVSWVTYHTAMHPFFASRLPYLVGLAELEEGPRLVANLASAPPDGLGIDLPLRIGFHSVDGHRLPLLEMLGGLP